MNNVYLKKLVEQETLNVKLQLVQEHLQIAKEEFAKNHNKTKTSDVLSEQTTTSKVSENEWPAPADKAQAFIKNLKKSGIPVTEKFSTTPPNYEVTITIDPKRIKGSTRKTSYKNLFRFYADGSVYDFNLQKTVGYTYNSNNNTIVILAKNPDASISFAADDKVLATIDSKGNFNKKGIEVDTDPLAGYASWLNPLQQILDYAGLIPVVGDALDAVNATLYFIRGRYFEGFLSLIAIIPIAGSVISLAVKTALKTGGKTLTKAGATSLIKRWWLKGDTEAMGKLGKQLYKNGVSADQLGAISKGMVSSGKKIKGFSGFTKKTFGAGTLTKNLDDAADLTAGASKSIDKVVALEKAAKATKVAGKETTKRGFKLFRTPKAILNALSFNLLPRLKRLPFYPDKKLAQMAKQTEARFIKQSKKRPNQLGVLTKFGGEAQRKQVRLEFAEKIDELDPQKQDAILNVLIDNPRLTKYFPDKSVRGTDFNSMLQSADGTSEFFTQLRKADKETADVLADVLVKQSVKSENLIWNAYKTSTANELISGAFGKGIQLQFAKNADIIYDEMQLADIGIFDSPEHLKNYGIVPFTKYVIESAMPGTYAAGARSLEAIGGLIGTARETAGAALGGFGIQIDTLNDYPPLGAEEETYQQEEK